MIRIIYILLGFISLAVGLIGIVVPGLPTVVFLLLTMYLFSKGSPRLNKWFKNTKIYHKHLKSFDESKTLDKKTKKFILLYATLLILLAIYFAPYYFLKIFLFLLLIVKYYFFIFYIKNAPSPQKKCPEEH